ncbi:MAG: hypothetical protein ACLS28_03855 [Clostridium neonatale]
MKIIIFAVLLLSIFFIAGISVLKFLKLDESTNEKNEYVYIAPLIGVILIICLTQILNIIFNVKLISTIYIIITPILLYKIRKNIIEYFKIILEKKFILFIIFLAIIILAYPAVRKNQLLSINKSNNDLIFYLSSMDWLLEHSIREKVNFSPEFPFYSCANYIITTTRFGFDILGSLIMGIFNIESYQIFFILSVVSVIIASLSFYFLAIRGLNISNRVANIMILFIMFSGNWLNLISYEYGPQILGIGLLSGFIATIFMLYNENEYNKIKWLVSLFIAGTATVYAEFASYMFIIYIIFACLAILKKSYLKIKMAIEAGIVSLFINPIGMYIAFKFNINILKQVSESSASIDAYNGVIMPFKRIISKFTSIFIYGNNYFSNDKMNDISIYTQISNILSYIIFIVLIIFFIYKLVKKKDKNKPIVILITAFFIVYWIYFRWNGIAYGEYKHLTSIVPFIVVFFMYALNKANIKFYQSILIISLIYSVGTGIMYSRYYYNSAYYYDEELVELRDEVEHNYSDFTIGIDSNSYERCHAIVYALKDVKVNIKTTSSYFNMFQKFDIEDTKYEIKDVMDNGQIDQLDILSENVVWKNNKFAIIENKEKVFPINFEYVLTNEYLINGEIKDNQRIINENGVSYGPYVNLEKGEYSITIEGNNLDLCDYDVNFSNNNVQTEKIIKTNEKLEYNFVLKDNVKAIEFRIFNNNKEKIILKNIKLSKK